jgi:hypothetical protein
MFRIPRVSVSMRELDRLKCIQGLIDKQLKQKAVAERLGRDLFLDRRVEADGHGKSRGGASPRT